MASKQEVIEIVNMVGAAYPWVTMTSDTVGVWLLVLGDVDGDTAKAAVIDLLGLPAQYPPSVGMIRQKAFDLASGGDEGWEAGWMAWKQHLSECRAPEYLCRHDPNDIYDPATAHTVQAIGWQTLCRMEADQEATIRAQFRDIWKAAAARQTDHARRHPAVQQVVDAYRQQIETRETPRIEASSPVIVTSDAPAKPDGLRPAPRDWQQSQTGMRRADFGAVMERIRQERGL